MAQEEKKDAAEAKRAPRGGITRRGLFIGVGSTAALLGLGALRYAGHNPLNRPPGGTDEAHLVSGCIRCERCYEACPREAIVPAKIEDGLLGMRSPMLDFNTGNYCDFCYEENGGNPLCAAVCPTAALELPASYTVGNPETGETGDIIIGTARTPFPTSWKTSATAAAPARPPACRCRPVPSSPPSAPSSCALLKPKGGKLWLRRRKLRKRPFHLRLRA